MTRSGMVDLVPARVGLAIGCGLLGLLSCRKESPPPPPDAGATVAISARARGNEPFWSVNVAPDGITWLTPDNMPDGLRFPPAVPVSDSAAHAWTTSAGGHALTLRLTLAPCQDTMSGEAFGWVSAVQLDSMSATGCGSVMEPSAATVPPPAARP